MANQFAGLPAPEQGTWIGSADREDLIAVLDRLPCGVSILKYPSGSPLYINRELLNTLGYSLLTEPTSRDMMKKAMPDRNERRKARQLWREILETGRGIEIAPYRCGDGETRVFEGKTIVLGQDFVINTWVDITQRQIAETRLRESETRFRAFFEESTDPFLLFNRTGDLVGCNLAACQLFHFQNKEGMIGKTLEFLSPPQQSHEQCTERKISAMFKTVLKHGNYRTEWTISTSDGREVPVELSMTRIKFGGRNLFFTVLRDITPWKEAQNVLLHAKTELENAVRIRTSQLVAVNEELRDSREELRQLSEYLQQAREDERTRIAREVHDHVGQFLTRLKMDLAYQSKNPPKEIATLVEEMKLMTKQIDGAIHNVREICSELRPTILGHFGLIATISWYLEDFEKRTGIRCIAALESELPARHTDLDILLFRIFQEAMTNILRHAGATRVTVKLKCSGDVLVLTIRDNGRGILKEEISHPHSFGIIGMRERVRFWGGQSSVKGVAGKGTTVTVSLPISQTIPARREKRRGNP